MTDGYTHVIVGAGSAGCILAARLSEDSSNDVLLLEAGGTDRTRLCRTPGMVSLIHTVPQLKERFDWGYKTHPRAETIDRTIPYFRGKVLGGSSAINGMVFVRGNRAGFDGWRDDGCPGWGSDDVLPYFRRFERFEDGESAWRGGDGPIAVTRARDISPVSECFLQACAETCGVPINDDYNAESQEGAARFQLNHDKGLRYSTSEAYLHPNLGRPNLTLVQGAMVHRVDISGGRARAVVYSAADKLERVECDGEILLCAGAVGTPLILMRSGVGPADHLRSLGLDVHADLPVGQNLHDHLFVPLVFLAPRGGHRGTTLHFLGGILSEMIRGGTWFSRSVFESVAFVKTDSGLDAPDLQIHTLPWSYPAPNRDAPGIPDVDKRPAITVQPTLLQPASRGEIRITSVEPDAAPFIDPHYLESQRDVTTLMTGIAMCREIMASAPISGELRGELEPGPEYADAAAMLRELPNRVATVYHPVGTCRMGSDARAVVDPELRVRGVAGLRVVDASVMPQLTRGNTNAPTMMIAEKAAELLRGG